jgi:polysaccharide pyruvyl transferase WcaK-like protein
MLWALRLGSQRTYRDQVSKEFLLRAGFDASRDQVVPDLVFGLPANPTGGRLPVGMPPRTVGLGVMGYYGWRLNPRSGEPIYAAYVAKLKEFVRWLLERGYAIRLLTGQLPGPH